MDRTATPRSLRLFPLLFALAACEPRSDAEEATDAAPSEASDPSSSGAPEAAALRGGVFTMDSASVEIDPQGCRIGREGAWTLELPPSPSGSWTAIERFGAYSTTYSCAGTSEAFTCTTEQGQDHRSHGVDANVTLVVSHRGSWTGPDRIEGRFELRFECSGSECSKVADNWTVTTFPCSTEGSFTGALQS